MDVVRKANTTNILSDRLTIEFVLEELSKGFPVSMAGPSGVIFGMDSTCLIVAPELGVFAKNSVHTLEDLADLWDARDEFVYGTRGKGKNKVEKPCPSMLAGTSIRWMLDSIPNSAIGGGFTRRVNFIYGEKRSKFLPWPGSANGNFMAMTQKLSDDLRYIAGHVRGSFTLAKSAEPLYEKFYLSADPDEFEDEATANYIGSKWVQSIKLAMVLRAAQDDSMVITAADLSEANDAVEQVIQGIKHVFRAAGESDTVAASDKIVRFLEAKGYATYQDIAAIMWRDVTKLELEVILQMLVDAGLIMTSNSGSRVVYKAVQSTQAKGAGIP